MQELILWDAVATPFSVSVQGPPGPSGLQGPIGAPGPAVSEKNPLIDFAYLL